MSNITLFLLDAQSWNRILFAKTETLTKYLTTYKQPNALRTFEEFSKTVKIQGRDLQKVQTTTTNVATKVTGIQQVINNVKKGAFKEINPSWGARFSNFLAVLNAGATTFLIKKGEEIQEADLNSRRIIETDLQNTFTRSINNSINIRGLDRKITGIDKKVQDAKTEAYRATKRAQEARELSNNALYEARQGRKILDGQIQKISVDVGLKIAGLKQQYEAIVKQVGANANNTIQQTIRQLQDAQAAANRAISELRANPKEDVKKLAVDVQALSTRVNSFPSTIIRTFEATQNTIKQVVDRAVAPLARIGNSWGVTVTPATITPATVTPSQNGALTVTPATVTPATVTPAMFSSSAIGQQVAQQIKQETSATDTKINTLAGGVANVAGGLAVLGSEVNKLKTTTTNLGRMDVVDTSARVQIKDLQQQNQQRLQEINNLNKSLQNEQRMNSEGIQKLNNLLGTVNTIGIGVVGIKAVVDAIPTNTINGLKPQIPPLVEQGICNSTRGGCMKGALDQNANDIGNVVNAGNNDLWNKINAGLNGLSLGADGAAMGLLNTINGKLGDLIPNGGIAGKLVSGFKWLQIDRALNMLTFATSVHNALMLSSGIGQTLIQALSNVLTLIGIKDDAGNPLDINSIINSTVEGAVKGIVGEENYTKTTETFAKFNRIYQAAINVLNSVQNLSSLILNAVEIVAGNIAIVANALKAAGVVAEKAYGWMNPTPDFENPWAMKLEQLQNAASTIATVTQAPLDVVNASTELTNATNELIKSVKGEGENATQGTAAAIPDHKATKDKQDTAKTNARNAAKPNLSDVYNGG